MAFVTGREKLRWFHYIGQHWHFWLLDDEYDKVLDDASIDFYLVALGEVLKLIIKNWKAWLEAAELDDFYVKNIICTSKNPKKLKFFWIHWRGYEPEEDNMVDWAAVKDVAALGDYICGKENHLNLRWVIDSRDKIRVKSVREHQFLHSVAKPTERYK